MRKIFRMALVFCLILLFTTEALAARPVITKQPETATTTRAGSVSFSVSVRGTASSYSWFFVNPETGKKISGKKLAKTKNLKGIKVTGPNRQKISLSHVPEVMHGWLVYCVVGGGGSKVNSEYATLLIYGMDPPEAEPDTELEITKQPEDAKVNSKGKVSFSVEHSGLAEKITWAFINPKNKQKVIGKNITKRFKNLKVSGINSSKVVLSNVPESMVGWGVYAHLKGKGKEINTETVTILANEENEEE